MASGEHAAARSGGPRPQGGSTPPSAAPLDPTAGDGGSLAAFVRRVSFEAELRTRRWLGAAVAAGALATAAAVLAARLLGTALPAGSGALAAAALGLALWAAVATARAASTTFHRWVLVATLHWIFFALYLHVRAPRAWPLSPEAAVGFGLLWAALVSKPWIVAVSGGFLAASSRVLGIGWTLGPTTDAPGALGAYTVAAFFVTALLVALRVTLYERRLADPIESSIASFEWRRRVLEDRLARREQEIERTVDRLLDAQKLGLERAISRKLAHELNNALTPLRGSAELLLRADDEATRQHYARRILRASQMAANLAESLLAYTRQGLFTPVYTDLGRFVQREVLPEIRAALPAGTRIESEVEPGITVQVDRSLLRHLVEQLVQNAQHASAEGGVVEVVVRRRPDPDTGEPVAELLVRDEGVGMSRDVADRAFEPFFSTKGPGEGRGLGLAMVEGIAARHGGRVALSSSPGQGTTVAVRLPLAEATDRDTAWQMDPGTRPQVLLLSRDPDVQDVVNDIVAGLPVECVAFEETPRLRERLAALPTAAVVVDRHHPAAAEAVEIARREGVAAISTDADTRTAGDVDTGLGVPHVPLDPAQFARVLGDLLARPPSRPASGPVAAAGLRPPRTAAGPPSME